MAPGRGWAFLAGSYRDGLVDLDRRVLAVAIGSFLFVAARMSVLTFAGIYFVEQKGIAVTMVGVAYLMENVVRALAGQVGGALSDRVGRRAVIGVGALLTALLMPLFVLVETPIALLAWSAAIGVAQGPYFPTAIALLIDVAPERARQRAVALNYSLVALGYTVGVAPAGFLAARGYGWLALASALMSGAVALNAFLVLPRGTGATAAAPGAGVGALARQSALALRDRTFLAFALLAALFPLSLGLVTLLFPIYADARGMAESTIGLLLGVNGALIALLAVPVNARLESRGPFRLLAAATPPIALTFVLLAVAPTIGGVLAAMVVYTIGEIVFSAAVPTAVAALGPAHARGAYQGAWQMVFSVSAGTSLVAGGLLRDALGWRSMWIAFALWALVVGVALTLTRAHFRAVADARANSAVSAATPEAVP